jgi:hypothetical protein
MPVTDRERDHMRRIGEIKAALREDERAAHLALSVADRLARSWALYLAYRESLRPRDDDPPSLYERARALGLYRP